jgi:hypothetical protein
MRRNCFLGYPGAGFVGCTVGSVETYGGGLYDAFDDNDDWWVTEVQ